MSNRCPRCSVIIPTHNRSTVVARAIDSVLDGVPATELEVIVVDDASTDATQALLTATYADDHRVMRLATPVNLGPAAARNLGLGAATGEWVLFLDSDDTLLPDALACGLQAFRCVPAMQYLSLEGEAWSADRRMDMRQIVRALNPGWRTPAFRPRALTRTLIDAPAGCARGRLVLESGDLFPAILHGDLFWLSGLIMRRAAALRAGPFNVRYRNLEDWDFTARLCRCGIGGYLDHVGFRREIGRSDQLSHAGNRYRRAIMHERIIEDLRVRDDATRSMAPRLLVRARAAADYCLGCRLLERHHPRLARAFFWRALRAAYKPLRTLAWLAGGVQLGELVHGLRIRARTQ